MLARAMGPDETDRSTTVIDSPLARRVAGESATATLIDEPLTSTTWQGSMSITTTAEAMHDDDVHRMRLVIRLGWLLSLVAMGITPLLDAPLAMNVALIAAATLGIAVSFPLHQRFADPRRYTERAVVTLGVIATFNAAVAILYFGAFSVAPVIMVIGIHFVARSDQARAGRVIWAEGAILHAMMTAAIASGLISDPGVFASDVPMSRLDVVLAGLFVQGVYALAYVTARAVRVAALRSIDQLHATTRLAARRSALMEELRVELERALRVGGPGRYSEQTVGSFRLGMVIGRGAIGEVYEAAHVETGEPRRSSSCVASCSPIRRRSRASCARREPALRSRVHTSSRSSMRRPTTARCRTSRWNASAARLSPSCCVASRGCRRRSSASW